MNKSETELLEEKARRGRDLVEKMKEQLGGVIVGQERVLDLLVTAVLADGHVLLEGLPGLGKTLMVKTLARTLSLDFNRIQFTPDLMPADITGTTVINTDDRGERSFAFEPGPLFTNLLLADEINRAGPKTQSALLQAMQEREVSIFGRHYPLDPPFLVFATQNPIELAGTYPLPEAQLDRFLFKVVVGSPAENELLEIASRTTGSELPVAESVMDGDEVIALRDLVKQVPVADPVMRQCARAVLALRPEDPAALPLTKRYVRYGPSPRALQALLLSGKVKACLDGRFHVGVEDFEPFWSAVLSHRVILDVNAGIEGVTVENLLEESVSRLKAA